MQIVPVRLSTTCKLILFKIYCIFRKGEYSYTEGSGMTNEFKHLRREHARIPEIKQYVELKEAQKKAKEDAARLRNGNKPCRGGQLTVDSFIDNCNNTTDLNKIKRVKDNFYF
jgi:hypothetical protein